MRRKLVQDNIVTSICHYYIGEEPDSPYYEVWWDIDTEAVRFVDPKDPEKNEEIKAPLSGNTVARAIFNDMINRCFPPPDYIEDPVLGTVYF